MTEITSEMLDPNEWLVIPKFGVLPRDVKNEGFDYPVYGSRLSQSTGESLITFVATARELVRVHFKTLAKLQKAEVTVLDLVTNGSKEATDATLESVIDAMTDAQSAALLYMTVMAELKALAWVCEDDNSALDVLALAASTLLEWATHGPKVALKRTSRTQSERRLGKTKLSETEKKQIIREYKASPVQYGTIKALARKFDVDRGTIGRVLNPPKKKVKVKTDN